jgi:hypothetical protein
MEENGCTGEGAGRWIDGLIEEEKEDGKENRVDGRGGVEWMDSWKKMKGRGTRPKEEEARTCTPKFHSPHLHSRRAPCVRVAVVVEIRAMKGSA